MKTTIGGNWKKILFILKILFLFLALESCNLLIFSIFLF